ncbi:MAG: hypothetical protein SGILL_003422 [Bacillariaceae sp.]
MSSEVEVLRSSLEVDREARMKSAFPSSGKLDFERIGLVEREEEIATLRECLRRIHRANAKKPTPTEADTSSSGHDQPPITNAKTAKHHNEITPRKEVVFISGESGTGKSSLATVALKDAVTRLGGIYATGKCDLKLRHQPLSSICQAYTQICEEIVNHPNPRLQSEIRQELKANIDVPLLELLGKVVPAFAAFISESKAQPPYWNVDDRSISSASSGSERRRDWKVATVPESNTSVSDNMDTDESTTNPFYHDIKRLLRRSLRRKIPDPAPKSHHIRSRPRIWNDIDATSAKNLLQFVFKSFLRIVSSRVGTVVMVLDDLQWAESSIEMLVSIVNDPAVTNLLLVMSYRSDEVNADHRMSIAKKELATAAAPNNNGPCCTCVDMPIGNISLDGITKMVMDLLSISDEGKAEQLSKIVHKRTLGNAYFVRNFLTNLHDEDLISFQATAWQWNWDNSVVENETMAALNVVELLRSKMSKFSEPFLLLLQMASCLGPIFEKSTLVLLCTCMDYNEVGASRDMIIPVADIGSLLFKAEQELLIEALDGGCAYKFVHDKVQEAALDFLAEDEIDTFRSAVGNCLHQNLDEVELESMISVVVDLIGNSQRNGVEIASLYLSAAERAMEFSAFYSAVSYVDGGLMCLRECSAWENAPMLLVRLHSVGAVSEQLIGNTDRAGWHIGEVRRQHEVPTIAKMTANKVLVERLYSDGKYEELWQTCLEVLEELGVMLPRSPRVQQVKSRLALRETKSFYNSMTTDVERLGLAEDETKIEAIGFMMRVASFALASRNKALYILLCCKCVQWSNKYGYTEHTASTLASFANVIMHEDGDWPAAVQIAELALSVETHLGSNYTKASTTQKTASFVLGWVKPLRNCRRNYVDAYKVGMLSGNLEAAGMAILFLLVSQFFSAELSLSGLESDLRRYIDQLERCKLHTYVLGLRVLLQKVLNLMGSESNVNTSTLEGTAMHGLDIERHPFIFNTIGKHHMCNLCLYFSEYEKGADIALSMGDLFYETWSGASYFGFEPFSRAMCLYAMAATTKQKKYLKAARKARSKISRWAKMGALNLVHQAFILNAEEAAVRRNTKHAKQCYRQAITASVRGGFLQDAGVANERYALFLLEHDAIDNTKHYMKEAIRCYEEWGAARKVQQLASTYEWLLES